MKRVFSLGFLAAIAALALFGCGSTANPADAGIDAGFDGGSDAGLPMALPFEFTRTPVGDPIPAAEITAFTKKLTGFWKSVQYFNWRLRTSFGYGANVNICPPGGNSPCPQYALRQDGAVMVKSGDVVTFLCEDGAGDNNWIGSSKVLTQAMAAYLYTGDKAAGKVAELYMNGLVATMKGFEYGPSDPNKFIMARAIVGNNQSYEFNDVDKDGKEVTRKAAIDYTGWRHPSTAWNTNTIHDPDNPYWGDLWVKNWRSKDDVDYIFHVAGWFKYVIGFAKDESVRDAAREAWYYMQGFGKDIVDSKNSAGNGYNIRSKNADGTAEIPEGDKSDLACFTCFDFLDKNSECTARISAAILGYGNRLTNNCQLGFGGAYEEVATYQHYYEYPIFRQFHISAILNTLVARENRQAQNMLTGLAQRIDNDFAAPESKYDMHVQKAEWERDIAMTALNGAAVGLPLTWKEARLLHYYYSNAIDKFLAWPNWDVWSLPDGRYDYRPGANPNLEFDEEDMAYFIEFCWSPFRNKTSVMPVDCDIIKDPSKW